MLRTEKMILKKTDEIDKWLSDATAIYDQALFYLRQEYFQAKKENKQPNYKKKSNYMIWLKQLNHGKIQILT